MNATISVICYKSKTLANGEHPLMVRIAKSGKKSYRSLGLSIDPKYWDFNKNKPKRNYPNREELENLITAKKDEYRKTILELNITQDDYTVESLKDKIGKPKMIKTVNQVFLEYIDDLKKSRRIRYAESCKLVYNSLIQFNKHLNIYFSEIDIKWLRKYEKWLRSQELAINTIGIRFRTLRTIYNYAVTEKHVSSDCYPFKAFKVAKFQQATAKRSLTKADIDKVINYDAPNVKIRLAIDIFSFSYLMAGINFVDIANLTVENIVDNRLIYSRKKTGKLIKIPFHIKAFDLVDKYSNKDRKYLFPILLNSHRSEQQKANRINKLTGKINKSLKEVGKDLNLPIKLTTYVARHSYATVLKRAGVSTSLISESLGHSSEKVTQFYLDSFENKQFNEAMKHLL
ncbi:MAG TPA: site-specific integrase [Draconibacterium sp.]|nr:site-specific integrase [Draconibacterium sp.]